MASPRPTPEPATATVDRALLILLELGRAEGALGVSELARRVSLPKASTHRLLSTLAGRGFVERAEGRYRLGFALAGLGAAVVQADGLISAARPVLEASAAELGETFFLVAERGGALVVLDKVEGDGFLRAAPQVGAAVPSHATAVGKLYRAFAPERLVAAPETRFTERTQSGEALAREVERARELGWAANRGEWIEGLSVVAAPVFGGGGGLVGALIAAASAPALERLGERHVVETLCAGAKRVSERLGRAEGTTVADGVAGADG